MSTETWGSTRRETGGAGRTLGSYGVAGILVASLIGVAAVFGGRLKEHFVEPEVEVKLVPRPAPAPPKEAPAPPKAEPRVVAKARPGAAAPRGRALVVPSTVPKELPREVDVDDARHAEDVVPGGRLDGVASGTGTGGGGAVVDAPPAPEGPPPAPEVRREAVTPPRALARTRPAYPEAARVRGEEAVVVVRFVVAEDGSVDELRVVRGHPSFDAVVLGAVRGWRFSPATLEGRPIRLARVAKIPFRLRP